MTEVSIPRTRTIDLPRSGTDDLRLFVGWPDTPPPPEGWPVVYVLDGNRNFPLAIFSARTQALRPALTHVVPALIVGIGYVDADAARDLRTRDYTPPAPAARLTPRPNGRPWTATGGAPALLETIETRVKPLIEAAWPVDRSRQTLFGHSLGGLFTLHAAFTAPALYRSFLASSPSIWFGGRIVLESEPGFGANLAAVGARRDLMISVGALEQTVPPARIAAVGARYADWVTGNRMVDNACELVARLAPLGEHGLDLAHFVFENESHVTAPPPALGQGLRIALRPRMEAPADVPAAPAAAQAVPLTDRDTRIGMTR